MLLVDSDVYEDPYEMRDALRRHPDLVAELRSYSEETEEELDEELPQAV